MAARTRQLRNPNTPHQHHHHLIITTTTTHHPPPIMTPPPISPPSSRGESEVSRTVPVRADCCSLAPRTIKHSVFHKTTRTPLYVHPSLWTTPHLGLLHVVVSGYPSPCPSKRLVSCHRHRGSLCPAALDDFFTSLEFHCPPFEEILSLVSSVITSLGHPASPSFTVA